jgi:DNA polymerase III subunit beta
MKFEVSSSELLKNLSVGAGVVATIPVMPIAEDFLFELKGGALTIRATNVENSVVTKMAVNGIENGEIAISAKMLLETLKALPDQPITIGHAGGANSNTIEIISSYGKYQLVGDNPDDFPKFVEDKQMSKFTFDCLKLSHALNKTAFAVSNDEMRLAMTGVLMNIDNNKIIFVATDAHKLIKYTFGNVQTEGLTESIILPKKLITLLKSALPSTGTVDIKFNNKSAIFEFGDTKIGTKLIEAKYPDFNAVIPVENPNELTSNKKDLQSSLRRIAIYANKSTSQVVLNMAENSLTLSAQDLDFSNEAVEQLPSRYNGDPMSMGFSSRIFIELLSHIDTEDAVIQLSTPSRPGIILPAEQATDEHLLMLIMPVLSGY